MPVQSQDLFDGLVRPAPRPRVTLDWSLVAGQVALVLALLPFGLLWWGINGAYSVQGLGGLAEAFGKTQALWYRIVALWTFRITLPPEAAGLDLPVVQPVLPWLGVLSATIFQVVIIVRRGRRPIPLWMGVAAMLLSVYDIGTTWFGLGMVGWIHEAGAITQAIIAVVMTFGLEIIVGFALRQLLRRGA